MSEEFEKEFPSFKGLIYEDYGDITYTQFSKKNAPEICERCKNDIPYSCLGFKTCNPLNHTTSLKQLMIKNTRDIQRVREAIEKLKIKLDDNSNSYECGWNEALEKLEKELLGDE